MSSHSAEYTLMYRAKGDSYWCFTKYMETIQADFMAVGMMNKLGIDFAGPLSSLTVLRTLDRAFDDHGS